MTCKFYNVISKIPFMNLFLEITGNAPYLVCSAMLTEQTFEPILSFMQKHPDIVVTKKMINKILKEYPHVLQNR